MKIAFLTPYLPFPPDTGGKIRTYHLLKQMASHHEVHTYSVYYGEYPSRDAEAIRLLCADVRLSQLSKPAKQHNMFRRLASPLPRNVDFFETPESLGAVRRQLEEEGYDLIFVDELVMAPYAAGLSRAPRLLAQQKVDYHHYWETAIAHPWGKTKLWNFVESYKLRRFQESALRDGYRACVVCSPGDKRMIHNINPSIPVAVMPNGVDIANYSPSPGSRTAVASDGPTLVYTGTMSYYPNIDAVLYFWRAMYPHIVSLLPNVRLVIVGHYPPPEIKRLEQVPNVEVTGSVPDVRPFLNQATAMIVPLRLGGGTRLKILEAMAAGLPVVSTSVGCQGLEVVDGEDILIADDPRTFAARTVELLGNASLQARLQTSAQRTAERYDWAVLVEKLLGETLGVLEDPLARDLSRAGFRRGGNPAK